MWEWLDTRLPGWAFAFRAPDVPRSLGLIDVQEACDRLGWRLNIGVMSRSELRDMATELWFLSSQAERLIEAPRTAFGYTVEIRVAEQALRVVREQLNWIRPARRLPGRSSLSAVEMRDRLHAAVWQMHYALLVLLWAKVPA